MEAVQTWYYLNDSRQIGPYSLSELRSLLAKDVISPETLVWTPGSGGWRCLHEVPDKPVYDSLRPAFHQGRSNTLALAFGVSVFLCATTIVANAPPGSMARIDFAAIPKEQKASEILVTLPNTNQPSAELAPVWIAAKAALPVNRRLPVSVRQDDSLKPGAACPPSRTTSTRIALSPEEKIELQLWRSAAHFDSVKLYEFYVRQYPSGTFADLARAQIKEPQATAKTTKPPGVTGTGSQKQGIVVKSVKQQPTAETAAMKASASKEADRCTNRNSLRCRQRCPEKQGRTCQRSPRVGG